MAKEEEKKNPATPEPNGSDAQTPNDPEAPKPQGEASDPEAPKPQGEARTPDAPAPEAKPTEPDWKDLYARLKADFDNYKKRAARERDDLYRYVEGEVMKDVLPTVDNLALALANVAGKDGDAKAAEDPFVKGVKLCYDTLLKAFKDHGAEPFDSVGKELDTEKMEAIATMPSPDFDEGKVSNEVKRGWMLKGKVLRVAQVVVSSGKPEDTK